MQMGIERHDSLEVFAELYPAIIGALSEIAYMEKILSLGTEKL